MITTTQTGWRTGRLNGLSTDTKPTDNIQNGDEFLEIDTGDFYYYDAENGEWLKSANGRLY